ncbi:hypothetical protein RB594_006709 [Gaeumannomyces avenae]
MRSLSFLYLTTAVAASSLKCRSKTFENLVTFGDSYTDNGRLSSYFASGGKAPPPGTMHPEANVTASGGLAWGQMAARATGARYLDYAVGGATCSNNIVSRFLGSLGREFPSVLEDQIPSFKKDVDAGADTLYGGGRTADNTVYAMWIGTNDLGAGNAFLVEEYAPGATLTNFTDCVWNVFDEIYSTGGRRFVLLNEAPLHLAPLYVPSANGGIGDSTFWPTKTKYNETAYQQKILQYTTTVNTVFDYGAPFNLIFKRRWPGAKFSIFDVHSLMTDMSLNPTRYFDAPANSTGFYRHCDPKTGKCADSTEPLSSFMWFDDLHPSERAEKVVAEHFLDVIAGNSTYGTDYH